MKIRIACPRSPTSNTGNRVTATRWRRLLEGLGHQVQVEEQYASGPCDVLIALHARRSHPSVVRYLERYPEGRVVVALTGTDLYRDIKTDRSAQRSLELAARLVVLQPLGIRELPRPLRSKARVIRQSVEVPRMNVRVDEEWFDVCVLGHLREVKDPFRTAEAVRLLPARSRLRVMHVGASLEPGMAARARREERENPRYHWLGRLPRSQALRILARSHLLVMSSKMEGGGNALIEALALSVPALCSRISGLAGTLGPGYPGYFPVGNTRMLAALLHRAETNPAFYEALVLACRQLRALTKPSLEAEAWASLLAELSEP